MEPAETVNEEMTLEQSFMNFDNFLREQRKELPLKLSQKNSEQERKLLLDKFFDQVEIEKSKVKIHL